MSYHFNGILAIDRYSSSDPQGAVVSIIADTESDLPSVATVATDWLVTMIIGSQGKAVDTGADYLLDSNGTWVKQPGQIFENTYDKDEIDSLLSGKQDTLTFDTIPTEDSTNPVESGGIWSPLAELVDNGAKNAFHFNKVGRSSTYDTTFTQNGITATITNDGTGVTISGTAGTGGAFINFGLDSSTPYRINSLCDGAHVLSGGTSNAQFWARANSPTDYSVIDSGNGAVLTSTGYTGAIFLSVNVQEGASFDSPITIYPMICSKAQWDVSHTFEPYALTNPELTAQKVTMDDIYGIGTLIPNGSDLNDYTTPGSFYVVNNANANTILHKPIGGSGFRLIVSYTSAANRPRQEFIKPNQPENIYVRNVSTDGNWTHWFVFTGTDTGA